MDKVICRVCNKQFEDDASFHKHLKTHGITQTMYYQAHFPRYDIYDGKIILYKNKQYYFTTNFNSRNNLKQWLLSSSKEKIIRYCEEFLKERKARKSLEFAPTQVELKTLLMPGIKYINDNLGGYKEMCDRVGLKIRFKDSELNKSLFKDVSGKVIFADTREQRPLTFENTTREGTLDFGDYRMAGSSIFIERKSLGDAWGTLTGGFHRFEREIIRARDAKAYLVILVESPFNSLEGFPMQRKVFGKIKIPVEFVYHNIRDLMQKYQHIQFLFVKDREEASRVVQKLFSVDEQVRNVDLQLLYDMNQL